MKVNKPVKAVKILTVAYGVTKVEVGGSVVADLLLASFLVAISAFTGFLITLGLFFLSFLFE